MFVGSYPPVNDTDPRFVGFNIAQSFLVNLDYSSSSDLYYVESDSLNSRKAANYSEFVFIFTSNAI